MLVHLLASAAMPLAPLQPVQEPPIIRPPSPPPPPMRSVSPPIAPSFPARVYEARTLDVEIRAGDELLWSGTLRVATGTGATFRRDLSQAHERICTPPQYSRGERTLLAFQVTPLFRAETAPRVQVNVEWQRPGPNPCEQQSTRTVEMNESVELVPGSWATVTGDAGLTVRIRPR